MKAIEYWLSFRSGSFSSTDVLELVTKDLGIQKGYITSGSHKTIPYTEKALKALKAELEKRLYVNVDEILDKNKLPDGSSFTFVIPGYRIDPPQNIIWRFETLQEPPAGIFKELLAHPGFVFCYAEDAEDAYRQGESWPGNYGGYKLVPENVKWTVDSSGQRIIDISDNPGRSTIVSNARLAVGWKMWFGKPIQESIPRELLLSFRKAQSMVEDGNGVIAVQLFDDPRGALRESVNRDLQRDFRRHIGLDGVIQQSKDDVDRLFERERTAQEASKGRQAEVKEPAASAVNEGLFSRWFGRKKPNAGVEKEIQNRPIPFGYKTCWIAVQTNKPDAIKAFFPDYSFSPSSWRDEEKGSLFITPAVNGWVFIKGGIPATDESKGIKLLEGLLNRLSQEFSGAAFFGSHRVVDYYSWVRAKGGKIERGYAEVAGEVLWDTGEKQGIENDFVYPHEAEGLADSFQQDIPDEEMVLQIAADWSIDPRTLDQFDVSGFGFGGK